MENLFLFSKVIGFVMYRNCTFFFARKLLLDAYFELNPSTKHVLRHKTRIFLFFHLVRIVQNS